MDVEELADANVLAARSAEFIAAEAQAAVRARGRFTLALSGGRTPWAMLRVLSGLDMPWPAVHVFQVDERIAPAGSDERNLTQLRAVLGGGQLHPMPVDDADLDAAATRYAHTLRTLAGETAVLDLVHLGLGSDGHTASLVPGDPVLKVHDADVALTQPYQGRRRMTLTYPVLNRARRVLWLAAGADKRDMLARLRAHDGSIPAGRVESARALLMSAP